MRNINYDTEELNTIKILAYLLKHVTKKHVDFYANKKE